MSMALAWKGCSWDKSAPTAIGATNFPYAFIDPAQVFTFEKGTTLGKGGYLVAQFKGCAANQWIPFPLCQTGVVDGKTYCMSGTIQKFPPAGAFGCMSSDPTKKEAVMIKDIKTGSECGLNNDYPYGATKHAFEAVRRRQSTGRRRGY